MIEIDKKDSITAQLLWELHPALTIPIENTDCVIEKAHSLGDIPDDVDKTLSFENFDETFSRLPEILKTILRVFKTPEEKAMVLFALIVISGSLMPEVKINYDNKLNYLALMLLVIYPPASGKGALSFVKKLLGKINRKLLSEYTINVQDYKTKVDLYKRSIRTGVPLPYPVKPKNIQILSPANISSSKLIEQLADNGIEYMLNLFETEADAWGVTAATSDFASMNSTILRQAFHHETISQSRKMNDEQLVAESPKLCVVLSGTVNQIKNIFKSGEDGLWSRFLVLHGEGTTEWKNVKPDKGGLVLNDFFEIHNINSFRYGSFF